MHIKANAIHRILQTIGSTDWNSFPSFWNGQMARRDNESSDQLLLQRIVIGHSQADNWIDAKKEWKLISIFDKGNNCICNHKIIENCVIRNGNTNQVLTVGNVCVNHFKEAHLSVPKSSRISLRRVHLNPKRTKVNKTLIDVAARLQILTINEGRRYINCRTSSGYDKKQANLEFREKINSLIKFGFTHNRPRCSCDEMAKPRQNSLTKKYFYSCYHGTYVNGQWSSKCRFRQSI